MAIYQTQHDALMEQRVAEILAPRFDLVLTTDDSCRADFVMINRGKPPVVIEVKTRYISRTKWGTLKIDKDKIDAGVDAAKQLMGDFYLVGHWADDIGLIKISDPGEFKVGTLTLNKPRDAYDVDDAVYEIPVEQFSVLRGKGHGILK